MKVEILNKRLLTGNTNKLAHASLLLIMPMLPISASSTWEEDSVKAPSFTFSRALGEISQT